MMLAPDGVALFRYDRFAIASGQLWRLLTAHGVHLNAPHLLLNLVGLFLLAELLWDELPVLHGLGLILVSSAGISALLWWLHPELTWYAGMSGILHALWAGCALDGIVQPKDRSASLTTIQSKHLSRAHLVNWIGFLLLIAKLVVEWRDGASIQTTQLIGAPVVSIVHLYGALIGTGYVLVWRTSRLLRRGNSI
jgi:rhomboid family GlyGly-CTERM serine protease